MEDYVEDYIGRRLYVGDYFFYQSKQQHSTPVVGQITRFTAKSIAYKMINTRRKAIKESFIVKRTNVIKINDDEDLMIYLLKNP